MPIMGPALFVGDSITVGLPPFVSVQGEKMSIAVGGISSGQGSSVLPGMLARSQDPSNAPLFARAKTVMVLGGTNDIGSALSANAIFSNLMAIWQISKKNGARVIAITVPPTRGYTGFAGNTAAIETKRRLVNAMILLSPIPDVKIDSDALMGDGQSPPGLQVKFDSGDHLHPRKDAMGAMLNAQLTNLNSVPPTPTPNPFPNTSGSFMKTAAMTAGIGGAGWVVWKIIERFRK